jgi:hypothetical protein
MRYWNEAASVALPKLVLTSTVAPGPHASVSVRGPATTWTSVALTNVTAAADVPQSDTLVTSLAPRFVPTSDTVMPPSFGPLLGVTLLKTGAGLNVND